MHLKNNKNYTIHSNLGVYMHLLGVWGLYINELWAS